MTAGLSSMVTVGGVLSTTKFSSFVEEFLALSLASMTNLPELVIVRVQLTMDF